MFFKRSLRCFSEGTIFKKTGSAFSNFMVLHISRLYFPLYKKVQHFSALVERGMPYAGICLSLRRAGRQVEP